MKTHFSFKHLLFLGGAVLYTLQSSAVKNPVDYVSTLSREVPYQALRTL